MNDFWTKELARMVEGMREDMQCLDAGKPLPFLPLPRHLATDEGARANYRKAAAS